MSMLSVVTIPIMLSVVMLSVVVPFGVTARNISNLPPLHFLDRLVSKIKTPVLTPLNLNILGANSFVSLAPISTTTHRHLLSEKTIDWHLLTLPK